MIITLDRTIKTEKSTIGKLSIGNVFRCFILEDVDRGLISDMTLDQIKAIKVPGETAIPTGTYKVVGRYSPRYKKVMITLLNVPGFDGILIHTGNTNKDTRGCLIPGLYKGKDMVYSSVLAYNGIVRTLESFDEPVFIIIK